MCKIVVSRDLRGRPRPPRGLSGGRRAISAARARARAPPPLPSASRAHPHRRTQFAPGGAGSQGARRGERARARAPRCGAAARRAAWRGAVRRRAPGDGSSGRFYCWEVTALQRHADRAEALAELTRAARQVEPIMKKRGWSVRKLSEFLPRSDGLLGLNINRGAHVRMAAAAR